MRTCEYCGKTENVSLVRVVIYLEYGFVLGAAAVCHACVPTLKAEEKIARTEYQTRLDNLIVGKKAS